MTKILYTAPKLISLGKIPREFITEVILLSQSADLVLDYWLIYKLVNEIPGKKTGGGSFTVIAKQMHKSERTVETYYYKAKKIIDELNECKGVKVIIRNTCPDCDSICDTCREILTT